MTIISGAYSATWNSLAIGNTESGFRKSYSYQGRGVKFDAVGNSPVDTIYQGLGLYVDFIMQEYDAAAVEDMRWFFNTVLGSADPAGYSLWQVAEPLVLTSCITGVDPQTITFYKTIMAPDFNVDIEFSATVERAVPMRLIVFPVKYDAGGYATPELPDGCNELVYFEETSWP